MGTFDYDGQHVRIEDADLALLQAVVATMLGRTSPFLLTLDDPADGRRAVWVRTDAPMRFQFDGTDMPDVDPWHLDLMTALAASDEGVTLRVRHGT